MSWSIDRATGDIVISGWERGIAQSPFAGIFDMRNVNISSTPGEVVVGYPLTAVSTSGATMKTVVADCTQNAFGAATAYYMVDVDGQCWKRTNGTWAYLNNTTKGTAGSRARGIAFYKGYLFAFRENKIDYFDGATWTDNWKTITSSQDIHYALVGQDDVTYFTDGKLLGSFREVEGATFDPGNTATYVYTNTALTLPSYDIAQSLAEQGTNLLVGGSFNAIYPWNRVSSDFNYPIFIAENFIKNMVTANTNVFIFPGNNTGRGRIYVTNGSQADLYFKFPDSITGTIDPYYIWGDAVYHRNKLFFSVQANANDSSTFTPLLGMSELWCLDLDTKALSGVSSISTGTAKSLVNSILQLTDTTWGGLALHVSYSDLTSSTTTQANATITSSPGIGTAILKTDMVPVGTFLQKKTFKQLEYKLSSALASGESIQITAVTDRGNATTSITANLGTSSTAGSISDIFSAGIFEKAQWVFFQVTTTGNSNQSGVRLVELRLR